MIQDYQFGSMTVAGKTYRQDLKIIRGEVLPRWWRNEGHTVDVNDVADIFAARPDFLVVGQGKPGHMQVTGTLRSALQEAGIELIEEPTAAALMTFNRLQREGKNVAGAFHLTC